MERVFKSEEKEVLLLDNSITFINSLRRASYEIKTLAFKEVEFFKNDSVLHDEILAHRIGLIPLKNEKIKEDASIEFPLKFEAKNDGEEILSQNIGDQVAISNIPLVRLNKGQKVEFIARAKIGIGREHSRHLPGLVYYYNYNKISLKDEAKKHLELAERFPKVFEVKNNEVAVKNEWACNFDSEDVQVPGLEITPTEKIVFIVESFGMMSTSDIIKECVKVLDKDLEELKKELS
ncbi:MAG: hypothetical protein QXX68_01265 [Candidatus Pacearchaeota archaeon]